MRVTRRLCHRSTLLVCAALIGAAWTSPVFAGPTDIPRILLVGDSWPTSMQVYRSFDVQLKNAGFEGYGQRGNLTTLVGVAASEYLTDEFKSAIHEELINYPTIDIVHFSLGGNDFVLYSDWSPSMPPSEVQAMFDTINANVEEVIDYILSIRPNLRVAICGYTFGNHEKGGASPAEMNAVWTQFQASQLALAQRKDRVYFIHNLGLMQYHYGIPDAKPPIAAEFVDYPGGYPDYTPFPGGDINFNAPLEALADDDMHLTWEGYDILATRCINEFYAEWLSWPVVLEILPQEKVISDQGTFKVTFSEAVQGVDASDFSCPAGNIAQVTGEGAEYYVTVTFTSGKTIARALAVVDDDSIVDNDSKPLGGAGAGNGGFSHNGALSYADKPFSSQDDFDAVINSIDEMITPLRWILDDQHFTADLCDLNGGLDMDHSPYIKGNGILDSCEFALIQTCIRDEHLDLSATHGVTHAIALAAWEHNLTQMTSDLGGADGRAITAIPGVDTFMAGLMTLGDTMSAGLPGLLFFTLTGFMPLPPGLTIPNKDNYTLLPQYFGFNGDADGDGATNLEEYQYFVTADTFEAAKQQYIDAALNPSMTPPNTGEGEGSTEGSTEGSVEGGAEGDPEGSTEGEQPQGMDFCATMERIYTTTQSEALAPLLEQLGDNAALISLIHCDIADLNGPFQDTDDPPDGEPDMPGPNGMLDGAFELGVLAELMNNPDAYASLPSGTLFGQLAAGVDPAAIAAAYDANYHALYDPLESLLPLLPAVVQALADITLTPEQTEQVLALFPDLLSILAGYATLGDEDSVNVVLFLTTTLKDFMSGLELPITPEGFQTLNGILGPEGDADGDGFTNRQEYAVFGASGKLAKSAADYVAAALDPEVNPDRPEGLLNFCKKMEQIYTTSQSEVLVPLLEQLGDNAALISMIRCDIADLNGPFQDTDDPPDGDADMPGPNGMLDGAFELGVIAKLINFPDMYQGLASGTLPGQVAVGVDAAAVAAAFDANYHALYDPLEPILPLLPTIVQAMADIALTPEQTTEVLGLFPNLLSILAGYATLGDEDSVNVVLFLTTMLKDFMSGLALPTTAEELQTLGGILGPNGDADGDGFTNRQEYDFFAGAKSAADYVNAALDPSINPDNVPEGEGVTPEGEGEGIAPEGEGEGIAPEGEGEGVAPEGEGEGVTPEGEGEGVTPEGEGEGGSETPTEHSADQNGDDVISLTELLRVIQFFNSGGYYCAASPTASEDGYLPGTGANHSCAPHSSDYNGQDWRISLTELLRLIQFFNTKAFHACPGQGTEDGFCPGADA